MSAPAQLAFDFSEPPVSVPGGPLEYGPLESVSVGRNSETAELSSLNDETFSLLPGKSPDGHWLPIPYQLKVSNRAKQVYLRVEPGRGLQVTIPRRYPKREIPSIVQSQREWVLEALADLDARTPVRYRQWPPTELGLRAMSTFVSVEYEHTPSAESATLMRFPVTESAVTNTYGEKEYGERLRIRVDVHDKPLVAECIASALKLIAKRTLEPWLQRCAANAGLNYKRMIVRGQRTVWGSCSSTGTISLNYKLLFLEPDMVEYVLLHELAHTRHMNHSASFWGYLERLVPNARGYDEALNDAGRVVPPWLELAGTR